MNGKASISCTAVVECLAGNNEEGAAREPLKKKKKKKKKEKKKKKKVHRIRLQLHEAQNSWRSLSSFSH
jgi:hypothetical protein